MAPDVNGGLYIIWHGQQDKLYLRHWNGTGWSDSGDFTITASNVPYPAIVIDSDDNIHVSWTEADGIYYRAKVTNNWSASELVTGDGGWSSIQIKGQDTVYIAWGSDNALGYSTRDDIQGWIAYIFESQSMHEPDSPCWFSYNQMFGGHITWGDRGSGSIHYAHFGEYRITKRYFAGGQQVATRVDGELFYHLNDPSGTSLTITDAEGDTAWQVVYDGYGAVLTGTMPVTLTQTLLDMPDGTTGLVHQGDGRYYDPALGRPLQPNPAGAPPTVPQALNRYAVTPLGQPGVFQATQSSSLGTTVGAIVSFSYGLTTQMVGKHVMLEGYTFVGRAAFSIEASKTILTKGFDKRVSNILVLFSDAQSINRSINGRSVYGSTGVNTIVSGSSDDLTNATNDIVGQLRQILPKSGVWAAQVTGTVDDISSTPIYKLQDWDSGVTGVGAGLDFAIAFGFQLHDDWGSPYLSTGQIVGRAVFAGGGSAVAGWFGGFVGTSLCVAGAVVCGPAVFLSVAGGAAWSIWGQPAVFEWFGWTPADRNLLPLN